MAGRDPANQPRRARAANDSTYSISHKISYSRADARELDGRLKDGHGERWYYRIVGMMKLESRAPFGHRAVTVFSLV